MSERFRAKIGENYYYLWGALDIYHAAVESASKLDQERFDAGNYYRTRDEAARVSALCKEVIKKGVN